MQALFYEAYTTPEGFKLGIQPRPCIELPNDVLIKVHAASLNYVDMYRAKGEYKIVGEKRPFPSLMGYDAAGVIEQVGSGVRDLKIGDAVYTCLSEAECKANRGSLAEYLVMPEALVALKPTTTSFVEAASLPMASITALASLEAWPDVIRGKTVLITSGLSSVGAMGAQIAKNVMGASEVIATVSTLKVDQVPRLLGPNTVNQVIDYKTSDPHKVVAARSIDFFLDASGQAIALKSLLKPTGYIGTVSTVPSPADIKAMLYDPPFGARVFLSVADSLNRWRASPVQYKWCLCLPKKGDLDRLRGWIDAGKVRPVVGQVIPFSDLEGIKRAATTILSGKGGSAGKVVVQMVI